MGWLWAPSTLCRGWVTARAGTLWAGPCLEAETLLERPKEGSGRSGTPKGCSEAGVSQPLSIPLQLRGELSRPAERPQAQKNLHLPKIAEELCLNSQPSPRACGDTTSPSPGNPGVERVVSRALSPPSAPEHPDPQAGAPEGRHGPWRGWRSPGRLPGGEPQGEGPHGKAGVPMARRVSPMARQGSLWQGKGLHGKAGVPMGR